MATESMKKVDTMSPTGDASDAKAATVSAAAPDVPTTADAAKTVDTKGSAEAVSQQDDAAPVEDGEASMGEPGKTVFPSNATGKIARGHELKNEGNEAFKAGDLKKACRLYRTVFAFVHGLHGSASSYAQYTNKDDQLSQEQEQEVKDLKVVVYCNLVTCYLKLGNLEKAVSAGEKAVTEGPENVKALYRAGQAYLKNGQLDKAKTNLLKAAKADPQNKAIRNELALWKTANAEATKALKEKQKSIFGGKLG